MRVRAVRPGAGDTGEMDVRKLTTALTALVVALALPVTALAAGRTGEEPPSAGGSGIPSHVAAHVASKLPGVANGVAGAGSSIELLGGNVEGGSVEALGSSIDLLL
jgi:hypothetical protein